MDIHQINERFTFLLAARLSLTTYHKGVDAGQTLTII